MGGRFFRVSLIIHATTPRRVRNTYFKRHCERSVAIHLPKSAKVILQLTKLKK